MNYYHEYFSLIKLTRNVTPLPNVTSPDTVRLSSSIQSGILSKRDKNSFTFVFENKIKLKTKQKKMIQFIL